MKFFPDKIEWSKLASPDFWLEGIAGQNLISQPLSEDGFRNFFLVLFAGFLVSGILIRLIKLFLPLEHPLQPHIGLWTANFIWMGALGLMWWLFNQLGPLLFIGSKLWLLVGLIWFLVVLFLIIKYFITDYKLEINYFRTKFKSEPSRLS